VWAAKRLDIGWRDLAAATGHSFSPASAAALAAKVEQLLDSRQTLACLSVRSAFDLLLAALRLPPGSDVLMSAVTIPDMVRIAEHHGLVPVPVDLDLESLAPRLDALEAAITPRARAIVVAHLFGSRVELEPIVAIARRHRLLVIEDLAQGFGGLHDWGHPDSDVALFSFGPIKTGTALGGALVFVRDRRLLDKMRELHAAYPYQARGAYAVRLLKYAALKAASTRPCYDALVALLQLAGCDYDRLFAGLVRGFPGPELFRRLRRRPAAPLLALLLRRLMQFDPESLARRASRARRLIRRLGGRYCIPGRAATEHSHWVVPILADDPPAIIAALARAGFHATQARSMVTVPPLTDRQHLAPQVAQTLVERSVFLPLYPELPDRELTRLADLLLALAPGQPAAVSTPKPRALVRSFSSNRP
jgi:perosamine synthetase